MFEVCFFHKGCIDGTMSAAVLKKYSNKVNMIFIPLRYDYSVQKAIENSEEFYTEFLEDVKVVWFVDISPQLEDITFLKQIGVNEIIIIDHHKTAVNKISKILNVEVDETKPMTIKQNGITFIYDPNECGTSLTYKTIVDSELPEIIDIVKDMDLWLWRYEKTEEVNDFLFMYTNEVDIMMKFLDEDINEMYSKSKILSEYKHVLVSRAIDMWEKAPLYINVDNIKIPAVNSQLYPNEIGNTLAKKYGVSCIFYMTGDIVKLSFRSTNNTARKFAESLGGGGHDNASGAVITRGQLFEMLTSV